MRMSVHVHVPKALAKGHAFAFRAGEQKSLCVLSLATPYLADFCVHAS
jgi:hypothetical protein